MIIFFLFLNSVSFASTTDVRVRITDDFELIGQETDGVNTFLGVPYAAPPIGDLRFEDPQTYRPTSKIYNASKVGKICIQIPDPLVPQVGQLGVQSEDCLFLNIYSPKAGQGNPVMIFFHGGGFLVGTGNTYPGTVYAANYSTVMVTINYRLGPFGFLYDGRTLKGNQGLKDQEFAIRWVKRNIAKFGGDPDRITIFGESAGSASVGYHVLNEKNGVGFDALFHGAIMESGTPTAPFAFTPVSYAKAIAEKFLTETGCADPVCLRNATTETLVQVLLQISKKVRTFSPTVDGRLVTAPPFELLQKYSNPKDFALVIGYNKNEGWLFAPLMWSQFYSISGNGSNQNFATTDKIFSDGIAAIFEYFAQLYSNNGFLPSKIDSSCMVPALIQEYSLWDPPSDSLKRAQAIGDFASDLWFKISTIEFLEHFPKAYLYEYAYASPTVAYILQSQTWMQPVHTADLFSVFGFPLLKESAFPQPDIQVAESVVGWFSEYAHNGSISSWRLYNASSTQAYNSLSVVTQTKSYPRFNQVRFWKDYVPKLAKDCAASGTTASTSTPEAPTTNKSAQTLLSHSHDFITLLVVFIYCLFNC